VAAELTFKFGSTGADRLARDMGKVADTSVLASRGARLCADALEKQRRAASASAGASLAMAKADDILRDAEFELSGAADKAAANEREQARAALEAAAANKAAAAQAKEHARQMKDLRAAAGSGTGLGFAAALSPTLIPVAAGLAGAVAAVGVSFGAALTGAGLFGAMAKTVLTHAGDDAKKLATLQAQLGKAEQARQQATTKAQAATADRRIATIKAEIAQLKTQAGAEQQIIGLTGQIKDSWAATSRAVAAPVLVPWLDAVRRGIGYLRPLVQPVADLFKSWGESVDRYFKSKTGSDEIRRIATALGQFSANQLSAIGVFLTDFVRGVANLGRLLGAHNVDFGAFATYLDQWGGAFARWSASKSARADVGSFLEYVHANGKTLGDLLKNLATLMGKLAPGLAGAGQLELKALTDFFGFVATLPKSVQETLGALLLLSKTGVIKVGVQLAGTAAKLLTGGALSIGGGAAAATEIRAAFATGGAAAAAEIRAAMAGGGLAGGAGGGLAGGAAAGTGGGLLARLGMSPGVIAAAGAGIAGGIVLKVRQDMQSGFKGIVRDIPNWFSFGSLGFIAQSASGWANLIVDKVRHPLLSWEDDVRGAIASKFGGPSTGQWQDRFRGMANASKLIGTQVAENFTSATDVARAKVGEFASLAQVRLNSALTSAGAHADAFRIGHLGPLGSKVDSVSHQTGIMQGVIANPAPLAAGGTHADTLRTAHLAPLQSRIDAISHQTAIMQGTIANPAPLAAGGRHADTFRTGNLGPLQSKIRSVDAQTQGLQGTISGLHGKSINVNVSGSGSGGVKLAATGMVPKTIMLSRLARGGLVKMGSGPVADDVPAMLSKGEVVVPAKMVAGGAVDHLRGRLPGFAAGGIAGLTRQSAALPATVGKAMAATEQSWMTTASAGILKQFKQLLSNSGLAVLNYAMQYLHKVPYVWGGSTTAGWDCSGFVSYVLDHMGMFRGRTTAAGFQQWAKPSGPVPGALAFYGFPAHHVGFVTTGGKLLSALGRAWGTTISALHMGDDAGYGIPPQGFNVPGGGAAGPGPGTSKLKELAFTLLAQYGWANQWPSFNSLENREAGWSMTARNPSSGAYGLAQFINGPSEYFQYGGDPNTALGQLTAMDNYIASRYGSPNAAWAHEVAHNWYAGGTPSARPGWAVVGEAGPELVRFRGGEQVIPRAAGTGTVTIVVENRGVIGSRAEVDTWLAGAVDRLARTGRLTYALRRSASAA
jgi:cell wall-associated NlpC family hydrolase